jgi:hypothetical protein
MHRSGVYVAVLLLSALAGCRTLPCGAPAWLSVYNTAADEFVIAVLEERVLLVARRSTEGEQLFYRLLQPDSFWRESVVEALLRDRSFVPRALERTRDGGVLLYGTWRRSPTAPNAELAIRRWSGGQWEPPQPLTPLNSPGWDGQPALAPDGSALVFVSDRPEGLGGLDLYLSRRTPQGQWETPQNLGPMVNTADDEAMPQFLPDGRLLFTTRGRSPDKRWKLFVAHPTLRGWEVETLLPEPLNSSGNDFSPWQWRDTLLLSSDRAGGCGGYDLYAFRLCGPVDARVLLRQASGDTLSGELELLSDGSLRTRLPVAGAPVTVPVRAFDSLTLRFRSPCQQAPYQQVLLSPCSFTHAVRWELEFTLPESLLVPTALDFPFPWFAPADPLPLTAEHLFAQQIERIYAGRATEPLPAAPVSSAADSALELIAHTVAELLNSPCAAQRRASIHITVRSEPLSPDARYLGPPIVELGLLPGAPVSAEQLALARARLLAAELQRRLPSPERLRWELSTAAVPEPARLRVTLSE